MLSLDSCKRLYFCSEPVTFRVRHRGLRSFIKARLGREPMNGDVYIFMSTSRDRMRLYYWNNGGEVLSEKILHGARFMNPVFEDEANNVHHMSWDDFLYLMEGVIRKDSNARFAPVVDRSDIMEQSLLDSQK